MIILYVKHNKNTTLILVVDNRVSLETDSASWSNAVNELTNHMKLARSDFPEGQVAETIFGIATVGHYSRLYIMEPGQSTLTDHPTTAGGLLEFRKDESQIVSLLLSIKSQASPVVFERADLDPGSGGPGQ
ncbi:uncharacterized protein B0H64DRAFT_388938 [Chaetomium fimeti]|uniref:Uncharacterized protein n=1 Tax=Chaetomium fimeti TaxID=1854472 RepID=A0AAE0HPR3_9PEZI|nr:hypothetical protein B0H64DRAFT_388938 [Chaetomium fimeti]